MIVLASSRFHEEDGMYKTAVRAALRASVRRLNAGDISWFLRLAHPDFEMTFPGDNSWARMFREVARGRHAHVTHRGLAEGRAFGERFVAERLQFVIEDILVNGPPWRTRVAMRLHDFTNGTGDGSDEYNNRAVAMLDIRWGRLVRWEDYEDTERIAAWDRARAATQS